MSPRRLTAVLGLFLLCVSPVLAQSDRGSITGRVKDQAGAVVPNAKVTATNVQTNEAREATTNDEGNFTIPQLPASIYTIKAEAAGFKLAVVEDVKVAVQVTSTVDLTLQVGQVTDSVTVSSRDVPIIQGETPTQQLNVT